MYREQMYRHIKDKIKDIECEDGGFNSGKLWKLKKKLLPLNYDPPTARKDASGKLLTKEENKLNETRKHYKKVF